jgi:hypothetical protein
MLQLFVVSFQSLACTTLRLTAYCVVTFYLYRKRLPRYRTSIVAAKIFNILGNASTASQIRKSLSDMETYSVAIYSAIDTQHTCVL